MRFVHCGERCRRCYCVYLHFAPPGWLALHEHFSVFSALPASSTFAPYHHASKTPRIPPQSDRSRAAVEHSKHIQHAEHESMPMMSSLQVPHGGSPRFQSSPQTTVSTSTSRSADYDVQSPRRTAATMSPVSQSPTRSTSLVDSPSAPRVPTTPLTACLHFKPTQDGTMTFLVTLIYTTWRIIYNILASAWNPAASLPTNVYNTSFALLLLLIDFVTYTVFLLALLLSATSDFVLSLLLTAVSWFKSSNPPAASTAPGSTIRTDSGGGTSKRQMETEKEKEQEERERERAKVEIIRLERERQEARKAAKKSKRIISAGEKMARMRERAMSTIQEEE